jgi:hypothetical protein
MVNKYLSVTVNQEDYYNNNNNTNNKTNINCYNNKR